VLAKSRVLESRASTFCANLADWLSPALSVRSCHRVSHVIARQCVRVGLLVSINTTRFSTLILQPLAGPPIVFWLKTPVGVCGGILVGCDGSPVYGTEAYCVW
jgi:hypothetical protein